MRKQVRVDSVREVVEGMEEETRQTEREREKERERERGGCR